MTYDKFGTRGRYFGLRAVTLASYAMATVGLSCVPGAPVDAATEDEANLVAAARLGDLGAASRLLQKGVRATARNEDRETALAAAAASGSTEIVRLLVTYGAEVNRPGSTGATPLCFAVARQDRPMAELLLRAGADPNVRDGLGATPLYRAVLAGDANLVQRLLDTGADPGLRSSGLAGARGGVATSGSALIEAVRRGRSDIAALLLDAGARVNVADGEGKPALFWAILEGGDDAALLLLERGANPRQRVDGYEIAHFARAMQRLRTVQRIESAR